LSELESLNEPNTIWEKPEEFMLNISKVQNAKIKLAIWSFKNDYQENYDIILNPVNVLKSVNLKLI
jgi:hypothetical protein